MTFDLIIEISIFAVLAIAAGAVLFSKLAMMKDKTNEYLPTALRNKGLRVCGYACSFLVFCFLLADPTVSEAENIPVYIGMFIGAFIVGVYRSRWIRNNRLVSIK